MCVGGRQTGGACASYRGQMEGSVFPGAGRGGWALLETRKKHSPEPGKKGALLSARRKAGSRC